MRKCGLWKEEAKLPLLSDTDEWTFMSNAMANMLPGYGDVMKMFVDFSQSLEDIKRTVRTRESFGAFDNCQVKVYGL